MPDDLACCVFIESHQKTTCFPYTARVGLAAPEGVSFALRAYLA